MTIAVDLGRKATKPTNQPTQTSKKGNQTPQTYGPLVSDTNELPKSSQDIQIQEFVELYEKVLATGKYNFEGVRIPLSTRLNIPFFQFMLYDYTVDFQRVQTWKIKL